MIVTSCHTDACFEAWMKCEDLLMNIAQVQKKLSKKIAKVVDECALICMTTFHALKNKSANVNSFAILCVGICEECAELCDELNDENFKRCAIVCRQCSETMSAIAFTNLQ
jgi:altronate dehydratase